MLYSMKRASLLILCALGMVGCSPALPNGYAVIHADRGKAWLTNPDGTLAHGALIKQLFKGDRHILMITFAATLGKQVDGPRPLDGNCYIALLIDTDKQRMKQVRLAEAHEIAAGMSIVEAYDRGCLQGMPTS